jgi:hypothetical protein
MNQCEGTRAASVGRKSVNGSLNLYHQSGSRMGDAMLSGLSTESTARVQTDNDYDKDVFNGDLGYQHQALSHKQTGCKFNLKLGWADAPDLI